jgi:hypothetical protein
MDATMKLGASGDSSLGSFLGRPTRIADFSWIVDQPFFERFDPWSLFLNDPRVSEKIANYELYRSKLHVKMVISGTGFHYGRALVSYNPYSGYDDITIERNFLQQDLVAASQKPHFFLNPTNNTGGQLDLPFFWHENYLSLSGPRRDSLGDMIIKSFGNLAHANQGNDPVSITVYAWASDVELTMPTSLTTLTALDYTPQSGVLNSNDEYGKGIVSGPASAVAQAAGKLTSVPSIAPYARATEMVAKGVAGMATHWGYSRPPIVTDIVQQKPTPTGNMSNTDAADAVMKLSLDSKQELTIDSRTVGLDGEDQMDISRFVQRESYLTSFTMFPESVTDAMLWNCKVTPNLYTVNGAEIHPTPMAYMAVPFGYWQGSIKYRFQIVKSNFHKGKILLRWDPRSHGANIQYNSVYSRVIDIAECDDFEIVVGWGQSVPFLEVGEITYVENFAYTRFPTEEGYTNGNLEVNVVNNLVSPSIDSSIQFNVFVSACEDMKFGEPLPSAMDKFSVFPQSPERFTPQSGTIDGPAIAGTSEGLTDIPTNPEAITPISTGGQVADQTLNVFFGESPKSIRELLRRYIRHRIDVFDPNTAGVGNFYSLKLRDKGLGYWVGDDPNGIDIGLTYSICTYAQWFMPCYAGWRGATRTKYIFNSTASDPNPTVSRIGYSALNRVTKLAIPDSAEEYELSAKLTMSTGNDTAGGAATTNIGVNNTIEVETPYYNGVRFSPARLPSAAFANGCHSNLVSSFVYSSPNSIDAVTGLRINSWKSVGEDFTLFFFTGCPILYKYANTPF